MEYMLLSLLLAHWEISHCFHNMVVKLVSAKNIKLEYYGQIHSDDNK